MRKIVFESGLLGVVRLDKKSRKTDTSLTFAVPDDNSNMGRVAYAGPGLEQYLGKTVYFGAPKAEIRIEGTPVQIFEVKDVFATVEESAPESPTA